MPLDDDFKMLERSAVLVQAKQPFTDWLIKTYPEDSEVQPQQEVYLIKSLDTAAEMEGWLRLHFNVLFEAQLFGWHTDEASWPPKRTYKMFREWFEVSLMPTVWDTERGVIEKI